MKHILCALLLALLQGCSSTQMAVVPRPDGLHFAAIYAAAFVDPPRDRAALLSSLAGKPSLTQEEQLYLLKVLEACDGTSSQKTVVLLELLHNPAVAQASRARVAEILPNLDLLPRHSEEVAVALAFANG